MLTLFFFFYKNKIKPKNSEKTSLNAYLHKKINHRLIKKNPETHKVHLKKKKIQTFVQSKTQILKTVHTFKKTQIFNFLGAI